jgi:glycosyltransferase involved in cell wall biosynthesis
MLADVARAPAKREVVPVWRVVFFGRLEERKGIKLFLNAVQVSPEPTLTVAKITYLSNPRTSTPAVHLARAAHIRFFPQCRADERARALGRPKKLQFKP